jgi:hypothetical protein
MHHYPPPQQTPSPAQHFSYPTYAAPPPSSPPPAHTPQQQQQQQMITPMASQSPAPAYPAEKAAALNNGAGPSTGVETPPVMDAARVAAAQLATADDVGSFNGGAYRISHRNSNTIVTVQLAIGCPLHVKSGESLSSSVRCSKI